MPFYEYQCSACGHDHEELQKVTDRPLRKCPDCGRSALRRLISAPVFRLKGRGWYETDFKSGEERQRNLAGEKEPPAEKPKTEAAPSAAAADSAAPAREATPAQPAAAAPAPAA
ncbi:MAG: zinc ribbon domain-containing protein, partial [Gammaproteobacteria bacterium]|nr:zinc ribbon domain-containing protein [Gammaproteobacteria bacterium]